jgi:single-strand DNA-binding protein
MQNFFAQEGNLGKDPEIIDVPKDDGSVTKKLKLSVRFPYSVKQSNGQFEDTKGFWATVEMWGRQSEALHKLLQKGARVFVMGSIQDNSFVATKGDREGQTIPGMLVSAQNIALSPLGIESITYASRQSDASNTSANDQASSPSQDESADEEIPFED